MVIGGYYDVEHMADTRALRRPQDRREGQLQILISAGLRNISARREVISSQVAVASSSLGPGDGCVIMAPTINQVAELQGLYGPFTMAERVVQKIWLREDFAQHRAVLTDGRPLVIRSTGAWNLLGGPDFHGARLTIAGREITGDIEVHFHATDWRAHGHAADRAYDHVVLHVVLFPPAADEAPARHADGREIPTLVLLPLLHRDLEEYASDDALEVITARDQWECFAELAALPGAERLRLIRKKAEERWRQKVYFAKLRIAKLGWPAAAHHTALEILGYRQNRAAMLTVAAQYPLATWADGVEPESIFAAGRSRWHLHGVRPANHPLTRLRQYQGWVTATPDWPEKLRGMLMGWSHGDPAGKIARSAARSPRLQGLAESIAPKNVRQLLGLKNLREFLARDLLAGAVGGTRLDNLVCDGFLPLLAAQTDHELYSRWFHWFLGDVPDQVRQALPKLGVTAGRQQPLCHGRAQGLLGWILAQEARASG